MLINCVGGGSTVAGVVDDAAPALPAMDVGIGVAAILSTDVAAIAAFATVAAVNVAAVAAVVAR